MKDERMVNRLSDCTAEGLTACIRDVRRKDLETELFVRLDGRRVICLDVKQNRCGTPFRKVMQTDQGQRGAEAAPLSLRVDADHVHLAQAVPVQLGPMEAQ